MPGFSFLVANDLHFVDGDEAWLEALLRQMDGHPEQPQFLLFLGDLVEHGTAEELAVVRESLEHLAIPVHPVIGNHDYAPGDDRSAWDAVFGAANYRFSHGGWQFLGLDTTSGVAYEGISVAERTLAWLDRELPQVPLDQPLVLFTHFPLGPGVRWRPLNTDALLDRFHDHRLVAGFSGHFHGATSGTHAGAALLTGRCCSRTRANHDGSPEKGYLLCRAHPDGVLSTQFIPLGNSEGE